LVTCCRLPPTSRMAPEAGLSPARARLSSLSSWAQEKNWRAGPRT
jgi:hypothetical protein